jgi:hypothetical protein
MEMQYGKPTPFFVKLKNIFQYNADLLDFTLRVKTSFPPPLSILGRPVR